MLVHISSYLALRFIIGNTTLSESHPMPAEPTPEPYTPLTILQLSMSFFAARVLAAGVQLEAFSHLAAGPRTAADLAQAERASERGMTMLLDALTGLQLLTKNGDRYANVPEAGRYLVKNSPDYIGAMIESDSIWQGWTGLVNAVRTGAPPHRVDQQAEAERFFPRLVRSLHILNREPARRAAKVLIEKAGRTGLQVLDVGCGSAVWSIAVAEADSQARLVLQDFPAVLEQTKDYLRKHGVFDRAAFLPGDLKEVDFGQDALDAAILGNIVHSEGEKSSRELLAKLHRALKPGGLLAIVEIIPNDERTGPPPALMFALNMLVHTEVGTTYTLAELRNWLTAAGFSRVETADIGSHSPLVVGVK